MLDSINLQAVVVVAQFVVPGYLLLVGLNYALGRRAGTDWALGVESIIGSLFLWAVLGAVRDVLVVFLGASWTWFGAAHPDTARGVHALVATLVPLLVSYPSGVILGKAVTRWPKLWRTLGIRHPAPTSWDFAMSDRDSCYVVVTWPDTTRVGGWMGQHSFASDDPDRRDLFIEACYKLDNDGAFSSEVEYSSGIWVDCRGALSVEFFRPGPRPVAQTLQPTT